MGLRVTGLDEMSAGLGELAEEMEPGALAARLDDPLHAGLVAALRRKESLIPKDTGALAKSLLNPNDRAHVFEISTAGDAVEVRYGSTLPQATYQAHRIPTPTADDVAQVIDEVIDQLLGETL